MSWIQLFFLPHRFFDKTKNEWEHREKFEKVAGKYDMVFMDYSTDEKVRNLGSKIPHLFTSSQALVHSA